MKRTVGVILLFLMISLIICFFLSVETKEPVIEIVEPPTESKPEPTITPPPEPTPEPTPEPEPEFVPIWTEEEVSYLTKAVFGEAGGIRSLTEQSAVIWCILNWCDRDGKDIIYEVTYPNRFQGYRASNPEPEYLRELVVDVLTRWQREKEGATDVGRTLPSNYYFFTGDGKHNHFRTEWKAPYVTWDWSLPSPYES